MKICKLIRRHSFLDVRVFEKEAQSLVRMGHDVTIMAPRFSGQLLNIKRKSISDVRFRNISFDHEGVHVQTYRAKQVIYTGQSKAVHQKWLKHLSNEPSDLQHDELFKKALAVQAQVYHAHEPETLYEAVQIKRLLRQQGHAVKVVFDAHELEAETTMLKRLMEEVDHIITVSDSIKAIYARRYPAKEITVIYNSPNFNHEHWADKSEMLSEAVSTKRPFTIAYEGALTINKGNPHKIIDIVNQLSAANLDVRFKILGQVDVGWHTRTASVVKQLREHERIEYGWAPYKELPRYWSNVDVGYIYFNLDVQNRILALPNKFFSLLNNGVPIVVNAASEMGNFIEKHQCGIVINHKEASAEHYVEQFARLYQDRKLLLEMSRNAIEAMKNIYCWEKMESKLANVYESLRDQA